MWIDKNGGMIPKVLVWDNGVQYPIDRILKVRKAVSEVGGCGILYECRIQGNVRNLFYERNRWFIESTKP
ncbi:hypothetical protein [[Eubacterium] hominis]|uniref:hypothetical protein n=1 Tax=[Eubacterium] hominis TaxID=2764325 RepID=UPI003A4D949B